MWGSKAGMRRRWPRALTRTMATVGGLALLCVFSLPRSRPEVLVHRLDVERVRIGGREPRSVTLSQ